MGVVGRDRRRRRSARLAQPLQQGRGRLLPLHARRQRSVSRRFRCTAAQLPPPDRPGPGRRPDLGAGVDRHPPRTGPLPNGASTRACSRSRSSSRTARTHRSHSPMARPARSAAASSRSLPSFPERTSHDPAHLPRRLPLGRRHRRTPERRRQRRQRHLVPRERHPDRVQGTAQAKRRTAGSCGSPISTSSPAWASTPTASRWSGRASNPSRASSRTRRSRTTRRWWTDASPAVSRRS